MENTDFGYCQWRRRARRLRAFVLENNEFWSIPMGLGLFLMTPGLLRHLDPTAGGYDVGVLQSVSFAIAAFLVLKGAAWLVLYMDFPRVYHWLDDELEARYSAWHGKGLGTSGRTWVALAIYGLYLVLLVALTAAML